jgi:hypothetical protein
MSKAGLLVLAGLVAVACEENFVEEKLTQSFVTGPSPHVVVETHNGSIHVRVGRRIQGVTATVVKKGYGRDDRKARESLGNLVVNASQNGDEVNLGANQGDETLRNAANYFVEVPLNASVDLHSVNGCIEVIGVAGEVLARTTNACITATRVGGHVDLHTTNGEVTVQPDGAVVVASTTNGSISVDGRLGPGLSNLSTTNGSVDVVLPRDSRFTLEANTTNGHVGTNFPITSGLRNRDTSLSGTVGNNPDIQLVINTTNGGVTVNQAP